MEDYVPITGPYRATRLWNEAVRSFCSGMPMKRHWRQLRSYDNCFTASEAVSWFHEQLQKNPHFGPSVTKEQTQRLLCKFLKSGIFEDVRGTECTVENFKDNSGLYRLTARSPLRNPRTPGRNPLSSASSRLNQNSDSNTTPKPGSSKANYEVKSGPEVRRAADAAARDNTLTQCRLTAKQLCRQDVENVWKNMTINQLCNTIAANTVTDILDPTVIKGQWVLWNVSRVGPRGVVQPMEDVDCPPSWVLYAMKSLVSYPESTKLPGYQGSELDVFKVICDYFTNSSGPLTTFNLYNAFTEVFVRSELTDLSFRTKTNEEDEDNVSIASDDSVQSLVIKMATPIRNMQQMEKISPSLPTVKSPVRFQRWRSLKSRHGPTESHSSLPQNCAVPPVIPRNACYETAFTSAEPETRIISQHEVVRRRPLNPGNSYLSLDRLRSKSGGYVNLAVYASAENLGSERYLNVTEESTWAFDSLLNSRSVSSLSSFRSPLSGLSPALSSYNNQTQSRDYENLRSFSSSYNEDASPASCSSSQLRHYKTSPSKRLIGRRKGLEFYYGAKACRPGIVTEEGKALATQSLQLLCLLLHPDLRRRLHLLLRFMAKVTANKELVLNADIGTRSLMINTFYRCIICAPEEVDYDELVAVRLVSFLLDNAEAVMTVPHKLCTAVKDRLVEMQREKVSPRRYEKQAKDASNDALSGLLQYIIDDSKMSTKEKRKRLAQFKEAYPSIFYARFPTEAALEKLFQPEKKDRTKSSKVSSFARIRSLRI